MQNNEKQIAKLIQSSSIILPLNEASHQILMLTRNSGMSFSNATVFPGGVCDKEDLIKNIAQKFSQYSKITAIRQLFEETGILLMPPKKDCQEYFQKLQKLELKESQIDSDWIGRVWKSHLKLIKPIFRLLTIQIPLPKRFDCIFFFPDIKVIKLNYRNYVHHHKSLDQFDKLAINKSQSMSYRWIKPADCLKAANQKQFTLAPPQKIILGCLKNLLSIHNVYQNGVQLIDAEAALQPIMFNTLDLKTLKIFGDNEYSIKEILQKQPDSLSRQDLKQHFSTKTSENSSQKRRIIVKNTDVHLQATAKQRGLLQFIEKNSILPKL